MPVGSCPDGPVHCQLSPVPSPVRSRLLAVGPTCQAGVACHGATVAKFGAKKGHSCTRHVCGPDPDAH